MTLRNLIAELTEIANAHPDKLDTHVGIYPVEELDVEGPNDIVGIDDSIENRVDINVQRFNGNHQS